MPRAIRSYHNDVLPLNDRTIVILLVASMALVGIEFWRERTWQPSFLKVGCQVSTPHTLMREHYFLLVPKVKPSRF